jgi:hypothetical protein
MEKDEGRKKDTKHTRIKKNFFLPSSSSTFF